MFAGVGGLLFVPVFKTVTLAAIHGHDDEFGCALDADRATAQDQNPRGEISPHRDWRLFRLEIDFASMLFFLGILLAVASLQEAGHLLFAADWLRTSLNDVCLIDLAIGLLSAIVDGVPLVAASVQRISPIERPRMRGAAMFVQRWHFLAVPGLLRRNRWICADHWFGCRGCGDGPRAH